jgi:hypothetical protein
MIGAGEYFGRDFLTSLGYCRGGNAMLVFACLLEEGGLTFSSGSAQQGGVLVINKPEHQIPLFAIEFVVTNPQPTNQLRNPFVSQTATDETYVFADYDGNEGEGLVRVRY